MDCPYYNRDYKTCNISGCNQDQGQRDYYCLTDNWRRCANYDKCSYEYKLSKKIRTNPDL
jgi:hypothetical protein